MSDATHMSYWKATRHPAPCLLLVLPLLVVYELGVVAIGGPQSLAIRNGADAWMRWLLASCGMGAALIAPVLIFLGMVFWAIRCKADAPDDAPAVMLGMVLESIGVALALWGLSRAFGPMLDAFGINLAAPPDKPPTTVSNTPMAQMVTFLGAGIYEEVIFRLGLFSGVVALLRLALVPRAVAVVVAVAISSLSFAAVHHIGTHGETVNGYVFVFRAVAGLIFTGLYALRGFGVAVGAHACYDVLVGIAL